MFKLSKNSNRNSKKSNQVSLYANLAKKTKTPKRSTKSQHHKLPKTEKFFQDAPKKPFKKLAYYAHPKRFFRFWITKKGILLFLKLSGVCLMLLLLLLGGVFAYFRKDIDTIRPSELEKRVTSNVNIYTDRNGNVLWEDKGGGNYRLVVKKLDDVNKNVINATIAAEDKEFYSHKGISLSGLVRAFLNNFLGGSTQGGSTLTQQLVKQVFFADEAQERGVNGIPRKIKEVILSLELERMYSKDEILKLYLNESPYGGRRNGVESGAQTYFGKPAKNVNLAEAALLASIPQNPAIFNPYNVEGHAQLLKRQSNTLNNMVKSGFITKQQADEAKKYPIIDKIIPESTQFANIKAPHFVQMAKAEAESQLGATKVGRGGLTIKTTLDIRIQQKLEEAMTAMFNSDQPYLAGFSNGASTVVDSKTNQIIALMGSRDFNYPGYGQDNAAIAYLQPGSSIKPLVYAELFQKKPTGQLNFGSGTILKDENFDHIYGTRLNNWDGVYRGDMTIRQALATSRNVPAVKAMYISGVQPTLNTIHKMGAPSYCTNGEEKYAGLSSAIGSCGLKQTELASAYSSLARMGSYKPQAIILEIKDYNGEVLRKWSDVAGTQIVDQQSAYIVADIMSDRAARAPLVGWNTTGITIPGIKTATKTGTSDKNGRAKDIWMATFSPALVMVVWLGNSDMTPLTDMGRSLIIGRIVDPVFRYAHNDIYAPQGMYTSDEWYAQPNGIQRVGAELFPSWWDKSKANVKETIVFDRVSKYRATDLTPDGARISIEVTKTIDPITKKEMIIAPDGYDASKSDNVHLANDTKPTISVTASSEACVVGVPNCRKITISPLALAGGRPIAEVRIMVAGRVVATYGSSRNHEYTHQIAEGAAATSITIKATVMDDYYYTGTSEEISINIPDYETVPPSP